MAELEEAEQCQLHLHHLPERDPALDQCGCLGDGSCIWCQEKAEQASSDSDWRFSSERCICVGRLASCNYCGGGGQDWTSYGEAPLHKVQEDAWRAAETPLLCAIDSMKPQLPFASDAVRGRLCEIAVLSGNKEPWS